MTDWCARERDIGGEDERVRGPRTTPGLAGHSRGEEVWGWLVMLTGGMDK